MPKVIMDIETVGVDLSAFDDATQEYLLKYAKTDIEVQEVRDSTSFYPVTGQVVAIGMLETETDRAFVYYQTPGMAPERTQDKETEYFTAANEKQLLELFWSRIDKYDQFVTFNGRSFDCPFIMVRSAVNKIRSSRNLMPDRYRSNAHIDLMEKLTFLGATRRKFSLHMWCTAFGIRSPKAEGVSGLDVKNLFTEKRYLDIARYCLGDVVATRELFYYWDKYINFPGA
jgi:DNA polymerase elongation subunit (family B)